MFGLKREVKVLEPPTIEATAPRPRAVAAQSTPMLESYSSIAATMGFNPSALVDERLKSYFASKGIPLFDLGKVDDYLLKVAKKSGLDGWVWRPMRSKDIVEGYRFGSRDLSDHDEWTIRGFYSSGEWACRVYGGLVPAHALLRAAGVEAEFVDEVSFFVSDFAKSSPTLDPFLMVRSKAPDGALFIFDIWDEPGFGNPEIP